MATKDITITEALAELRTIVKRVAAKEQFILGNIGRHSMTVDPHGNDGGSEKLVAEAMQSRGDLLQRLIDIRTAIQLSNLQTKVTVTGVERTISEWLAWRREVEGTEHRFMNAQAATIAQARNKVHADRTKEGMEKADLIVYVNEADLAERHERHEQILGELDGKLTLTNSLTTINV